MNLVLAEQFFVEKCCTEFLGNPRDDLVADTRLHTDGRIDMVSVRGVPF
jgi:hypothetical protein